MRREYARLEQELQDKEYETLLQKLKEKALFFRRFDTWADVVAFMRDGASNDRLTDDVLKPIFEAHAESEDHRWRTTLLVIFWPGLESIHWRKRGWDPDIEERWQNIIWTFLQVICRIDISRRPDRLVQKVINETVHHLYNEYRGIWKAKRLETAPENGEFDFVADDREGIDSARVALQYAQRAEIGRLKKHMEEGRIGEADYLMLVGTRVYGKPLLAYSLERGLDYEAVKKRRLRVEAAIRDHEKNLQNMSREVGQHPPLYGVGNLNRKG
jgi:hypothetical protein